MPKAKRNINVLWRFVPRNRTGELNKGGMRIPAVIVETIMQNDFSLPNVTSSCWQGLILFFPEYLQNTLQYLLLLFQQGAQEPCRALKPQDP